MRAGWPQEAMVFWWAAGGCLSLANRASRAVVAGRRWLQAGSWWLLEPCKQSLTGSGGERPAGGCFRLASRLLHVLASRLLQVHAGSRLHVLAGSRLHVHAGRLLLVLASRLHVLAEAAGKCMQAGVLVSCRCVCL